VRRGPSGRWVGTLALSFTGRTRRSPPGGQVPAWRARCRAARETTRFQRGPQPDLNPASALDTGQPVLAASAAAWNAASSMPGTRARTSRSMEVMAARPLDGLEGHAAATTIRSAGCPTWRARWRRHAEAAGMAAAISSSGWSPLLALGPPLQEMASSGRPATERTLPVPDQVSGPGRLAVLCAVALVSLPVTVAVARQVAEPVRSGRRQCAWRTVGRGQPGTWPPPLNAP